MNMILDFLADIVKRFLAKQPKFFVIVTNLAVILAVITGIPGLLEEAGVVLPAAIEAVSNKVIAVVTVVAAFISKLTVKDVPAANLKIK